MIEYNLRCFKMHHLTSLLDGDNEIKGDQEFDVNVYKDHGKVVIK